MPIFDHDGTAAHPIGNVYDHDGTTARQIGKIFDHDGTSARLIYPVEFNALANGAWSSKYTGGDKVYVYPTLIQVRAVGATMPMAYMDIDVSSYSTITITLNSYTLYAIAAAGLYKGEPGFLADPVAGFIFGNTDGTQGTSNNGTFTYDVSSLSGVHRFAVWAYAGSVYEATIDVTKLIFE